MYMIHVLFRQVTKILIECTEVEVPSVFSSWFKFYYLCFLLFPQKRKSIVFNSMETINTVGTTIQ